MRYNTQKQYVGIPLFERTDEFPADWALVDFEDAEKIVGMGKWRKSQSGYAWVRIGTGGKDRKRILMHRVILGIHEDYDPDLSRVEHVGDHINRNRLDNRRVNLRLATHSQNAQNVKTCGAVPYIGVTKNGWGYMARISSSTRKRYSLGTFRTPEEAAMAYNLAAIEIHGPHARVNQI